MWLESELPVTASTISILLVCFYARMLSSLNSFNYFTDLNSLSDSLFVELNKF